MILIMAALLNQCKSCAALLYFKNMSNLVDIHIKGDISSIFNAYTILPKRKDYMR